MTKSAVSSEFGHINGRNPYLMENFNFCAVELKSDFVRLRGVGQEINFNAPENHV